MKIIASENPKLVHITFMLREGLMKFHCFVFERKENLCSLQSFLPFHNGFKCLRLWRFPEHGKANRLLLECVLPRSWLNVIETLIALLLTLLDEVASQLWSYWSTLIVLTSCVKWRKLYFLFICTTTAPAMSSHTVCLIYYSRLTQREGGWRKMNGSDASTQTKGQTLSLSSVFYIKGYLRQTKTSIKTASGFLGIAF